MAITINHATKVISIPQADLTFISGSLYELNVNTFRQTLKGLEDDADGMMLADTHKHNTEVTVGGVTLARVVEIINGYTVTFEAGNYRVRLVGGNSNIADVTNLNSVQVMSQNSAGLIISGSGVTDQDKTDIADRVGSRTISELAAAPPAQPTLFQAIAWFYMQTRNLMRADKDTLKQHVTNDAGSVVAQAALSDDGAVFTRGKFVAP